MFLRLSLQSASVRQQLTRGIGQAAFGKRLVTSHERAAAINARHGHADVEFSVRKRRAQAACASGMHTNATVDVQRRPMVNAGSLGMSVTLPNMGWLTMAIPMRPSIHISSDASVTDERQRQDLRA